MNIVDGTGRTIEGATVLATVHGAGTIFLVRLPDGSTRLISRTQVKAA